MTVAHAPRTEEHHRTPRCLLGFFDRAAGGLDAEGFEAWAEWEREAHRYGVDPRTSREALAALIEGSTVELPRDEHREIHGDDRRAWGRRGGLATLARYGPAWFSLLGRRRRKGATRDELARHRAGCR